MQTTQEKNCNVDAVCVEVFSKITASMSHEVKNVLAIINENSGLLEDLALMGGDQGVPLAKVTVATSSIGRQVSRANRIMRNINRFSHLGDTPMSEEALQEMIQLAAGLAERQVAMKNITLVTDCPVDLRLCAPMNGLVSMFYLLIRSLVELCEGGTILAIAGSGKGPRLQVGFAGSFRLNRIVELPSYRELLLLFDYLGVDPICLEGRLQLSVPRS